MNARVCSDKVRVHRLQIVAPRGQPHPLALEPGDEAVQIVEASAFGAPVDDLHQRRAGLELHADSGGAQACADLALDRRAQRDQPRIDDGLGAGCLQQVRTGSQPTASTSSAPTATFTSRLRWVAASCARCGQMAPPVFAGRPCCCRGARAFRRLRAASSCGRQCRADAGRRCRSRSRSAPVRARGSDRSGSGDGLTEAKAIAGCGPSRLIRGSSARGAHIGWAAHDRTFCCLLWLARSDAMRAMQRDQRIGFELCFIGAALRQC